MINIKQFILGSKFSMLGKKSSALQNPYVKGAEGRREWNDRYMNMSQSIRHWQMAFFIAMMVVILFGFIVTRIATESRVQPFIVETNNGMPYAIKPMESISAQDQRLINFAVNQFIVNARTIVSDAQAEKTDRKSVV